MSCLGIDDPSCNSAWNEDCSAKVYCSDATAGYRISCLDIDPFSTTVDVERVCDPTLPPG